MLKPLSAFSKQVLWLADMLNAKFLQVVQLLALNHVAFIFFRRVLFLVSPISIAEWRHGM